jgi:hypothetical protein
MFIIFLNAVEAFHAPFGGFECFFTRGGLASSTLILGLVALEGSTIPISYRSLLMKALESVLVCSSFFASSTMAFNNSLFNN